MAKRLARLQASGALGRTSERVMHALGDAEYWLELIGKLEAEENLDKLTTVLMFHQQMRDGRPAQQINVTSATVHFSPEQIARARATVRQLTTVNPPELTTVDKPLLTLIPSTGDSSVVRGEDKANDAAQHNASEGQGQEKDGR